MERRPIRQCAGVVGDLRAPETVGALDPRGRHEAGVVRDRPGRHVEILEADRIAPLSQDRLEGDRGPRDVVVGDVRPGDDDAPGGAGSGG